MTRPKRVLLIACGTASVGVGVVGAFVPILPTTPFLLLAAYLFARSSERLYGWLLGNRVIGDYLRRYYEGRCMSGRHKVLTLSLLWSVLSSTAAVAVGAWWVRGVLGGVGIAVTAHILMLPRERNVTS
jgi:uncharacterized membrane protein YbaN (DUF454 family)